MKDDIAIEEVHAFVDGELDLSRRLEIERAIGRDPRLRARVDAVRELRRQLRDGGDYHAAPDALRARIAALAGPPFSRPRVATTRRTWWTWRPLAGAVAAVFAATVGLQLWLVGGDRDARLADQVVASHVRATLGQHLIDVDSSDHHTVRPWLSSKLGFSPPVHDAQLGGAVFVGGRVDYLDGRPVAALVYRQGPHVVDAFVWPTSDGDRHATYTSDRGYQIAHWSRDGMTHWLISDVNRAEFMNLVAWLATPVDGQSPP